MEAPACGQPLIASQFLRPGKQPLGAAMRTYLPDMYENNFNYYHYQPWSNIIIVYCKHITHAHMRTRAHAHTPGWHSGFRCSMGRCRPTVTARSAGDNGRRCFIQINTCEGDPVSQRFVCFSRIHKKKLRTV